MFKESGMVVPSSQEIGFPNEVLDRFDTVRMDLQDEQVLRRASRSRALEDYSPEDLSREPYTLPAYVLRGLANTESANNLLRLGIPDLHLEIVRFPVTSETGEVYLHPMKVMTAFTFNEKELLVKVGGPVFVSDLHEIITSDLPLEQKLKIVEGALALYKDQMEHEVVVISIPKRKYTNHSLEIIPENSLTHTLLLRQAGGDANYREIILSDGNERGLYFLTGNKNKLVNQAKRQALMDNPEFLSTIDRIGSAWGQNFYREAPLSPEDGKALSYRQRDEMIKLMARSWK